MRVPVSWLGDYVDLSGVGVRTIADGLTAAGLPVEHIDETGADIVSVVVARVLAIEELTQFKKPIRWVTLTDGSSQRQVICGATNFAVDDVVAYARPPAELPGGFRVERRPAYGHDSDGMICSARELGLGEDHTGILRLGHGDDPTLPLGTDVVDALSLRDQVLDINVNPDRGYALSIRGIGREVGIALSREFRDPADVAVPAATAAGHPVRIDDASGCDRYVARVVTSLDTAAASPQWLQRRLTLAGMRPISLAVDVTNHVMLDVGQPLHAFDRTTLTGGIEVRRATAGERLRTLDDVDRALDQADLVIADESGPVALAGVMGGARTEVSATTTDLLIEAAHFDAVSIAYTARRHRLPSEASRRFERGVDSEVAPAAAQLAVDLLTRLGGAAPDDGGTDTDMRAPRESITLDVTLPGRLAGVPYDATVVRRRLTDVGCAVTGDDPLAVTPPPWRPDLRIPVDLVEEVARLEGYDSLPISVPRAPAGRGLTRPQRQRRRVTAALADSGYTEVLTYPFVAAGSADALMFETSDPRRPTLRVANPVSDEEPLLRASLLPGLLTTLVRNVGRGFPDVALFEIGTVFRRGRGGEMPRPPAAERPAENVLRAMDAALPDQPLHAAVVAAGAWERAGWWGAGRAVGWADPVEAGRSIADAVGVSVDAERCALPPWHPGRCAALRVAGDVVGHAGELHPRVIESLGLPPRTCAMELALGPVLAAAPEVATAPLVSAYPPATLDVALVVAAEVPAAAVGEALRAGAGPLLEHIRLFDVYVGEQIRPGHRSLAFSLRFRAPDRTLTVEEAVASRDAAVAVAAERLGAVLRD